MTARTRFSTVPNPDPQLARTRGRGPGRPYAEGPCAEIRGEFSHAFHEGKRITGLSTGYSPARQSHLRFSTVRAADPRRASLKWEKPAAGRSNIAGKRGPWRGKQAGCDFQPRDAKRSRPAAACYLPTRKLIHTNSRTGHLSRERRRKNSISLTRLRGGATSGSTIWGSATVRANALRKLRRLKPRTKGYRWFGSWGILAIESPRPGGKSEPQRRSVGEHAGRN